MLLYSYYCGGGSSLGNPGVGGLVRNSLGKFIKGFLGSCGHTTSLHAELLAISHGFIMA